MPLSLLYRITRARASWRRISGLTERLRSYQHRGWLILGLTITPAVLVPIIILTGNSGTTSSYSTSFLTSSSTLCQSCHGIGEVGYVPEEKRIVTEAEQGILPVHEERDRHKQLLNDWKKAVVRHGTRIYVAEDGQEYKMSLTGTCLACHSNQKGPINQGEFCVRCHSYAAVRPNCWNCHNLPKED